MRSSKIKELNITLEFKIGNKKEKIIVNNKNLLHFDYKKDFVKGSFDMVIEGLL